MNGYTTHPFKKLNLAICDNIDGSRGVMISKISQTRKKNPILFHLQVESKKKKEKKKCQIHRNGEQNGGC